MEEKTQFYTSVSVLVGTTIGAGVLGIPYVAAKAGFFVALTYIVFLGCIVLIINLYLGEVVLRTKGNHQIAGYAKIYFGRVGRFFTEFSIIFGIYSALIAYMLGIGESFSFLIYGNTNFALVFGVLTGLIMSGLLWRGLKTLKYFEKFGLAFILFLFVSILFMFIWRVDVTNLTSFNLSYVFLPFGVILFALISFSAIPQINFILSGKNKKCFRKILITGSAISIIFYSLFALIVVGFQGQNTPEVATLALGVIFIFLGILTMFTSYLALGNALSENFRLDDRMNKKISWFLSSIGPVIVFVLIKIIAFDFFSFTKILSIGGVISGGIIAIISLLMVKKAKQFGNRNPEYKVPVNWLVISILVLVFIFGIAFELV